MSQAPHTAAQPSTGSDQLSTMKTRARRSWSVILFPLLLTAAVFLAYKPAWGGRTIWDDDRHITTPQLQSWQGLERIWFDLGATQQYYPLLHSAFWFEHQLWGDATIGYHLTNLALHALVAILAWLVLRRLTVPGAYLAAVIFALHPIQVESVAWISEQKNTLSAVFYLAAMLAYLRFDRTRAKRAYRLALVLFVLGLLSKTVTATLPGALLVIFWWKRGRLSWRTDVKPLLPFFVLGAAGGVMTAWVERTIIGAEGQGYNLTVIERGLIAGRVVWFYLAKLLWPAKLIFIYPRWQVSQGVAWQYLFPLATAAVLLALWLLRRRSRALLAAALFFVGTLFPVLGFLNVYPFIFSFVADHFQYLASLGIIALVSAGITLGLQRWHASWRPIGHALCLAVVAVLAVLTWMQSRMYADEEALYQTTIDANPRCFLAYNNLGLLLADRGETEQAIADYRMALESNPDYALAHNNLGLALLLGRGQIDEAMAHFQRALEIQPDLASAHNSLGIALLGLGQVDEAMAHFQRAVEIQPDYVEAHSNLGNALARRGRLDEAIAQYQIALEIKPDYASARVNLGSALRRCGRANDAIAQYQKALEIKPDYAEAYIGLGNILLGRGQADEAIAQYQKAIAIKPNYAEGQYNLGVALAGRGRLDEAIAHYQKAVAIKPDFAEAHANLGVALAGCGRLDEAIAQYQKALEIKPDYAAARRDLEAARARQR